MNGDRQLERALPEILADLGAGPNPDYTRSLLARTARARQRPAWVFPGRWINVDVALRPSAAAPSAKRFVALATLLLIAALAAAGLYVGSRPRVPAPFGRPATVRWSLPGPRARSSFTTPSTRRLAR